MRINYKIGNENYSIFIRRNIDNTIINQINKLNCDKKILLIYDDNINKSLVENLIKKLKQSGCDISAFKFKGNKKNKNEKTLFSLLNLIVEKKFTKKSLLISFGGGVLSDVCALASSLYHRGIFYFNIPSTMTSIIDSCIGGKTGINYQNVINSIGNYYHAKCVFIYHDVILNLPEREYNSGIPEIIKCGLIKKNKILDILKKNKSKIFSRDFSVINKICSETLKTKIYHFKDDVNEKGKRLYLNFGHTFAHSIEMSMESILRKEIMRHGEAVGIGILCELFLANNGKNKIFNLTEELLDLYNLPTKISFYKLKIPKQKLLDTMYKNIFLDKKKINIYPRYISLKNLYRPKTVEIEDTIKILETLKNFI